MEAKRQLSGDEVGFWQDTFRDTFNRLLAGEENGEVTQAGEGGNVTVQPSPAPEIARFSAKVADLAVAELRERTPAKSVTSPEMGWRVMVRGLPSPAVSLAEAQRMLTDHRSNGRTCHLEGTVNCGVSWQRLGDDGLSTTPRVAGSKACKRVSVHADSSGKEYSHHVVHHYEDGSVTVWHHDAGNSVPSTFKTFQAAVAEWPCLHEEVRGTAGEPVEGVLGWRAVDGDGLPQTSLIRDLAEAQRNLSVNRSNGRTGYLERCLTTWQRCQDDGNPVLVQAGPPPGRPGLHLDASKYTVLLHHLATLRGYVVGLHAVGHGTSDTAGTCPKGCRDVLAELTRVDELVSEEG